MIDQPLEGMDMVFDEKTQKEQYPYVYASKTLDHYEKYGIHEVHRSPMHLPQDALMYDMISNQQVKHLVDQGVEIMRVNVGAYISILCHIESINVQSH